MKNTIGTSYKDTLYGSVGPNFVELLPDVTNQALRDQLPEVRRVDLLGRSVGDDDDVLGVIAKGDVEDLSRAGLYDPFEQIGLRRRHRTHEGKHTQYPTHRAREFEVKVEDGLD